MKVEDQLIFLNQKKGLNFSEIAALVGCSERTLNNIKKSGSGRRVTLERIGDLYKDRFSEGEDSENRIMEPHPEYEVEMEWVNFQIPKKLLRDSFECWKNQGFRNRTEYLCSLIRADIALYRGMIRARRDASGMENPVISRGKELSAADIAALISQNK